jgi:L-alanine-DL-glutamate epimerase-like enolase superfamily enzyme
MSQGVPRTHVESLYVRVTTSGGVVGWGESFGTARPMVVAAFDNWITRLAVGQKVSDEQLLPRIERVLLSLSRSGPLAHALAGLDIALWDIRGKLAVFRCRRSLAAPSERRQCYASCFNIPATQNTLSATPLALSSAPVALIKLP